MTGISSLMASSMRGFAVLTIMAFLADPAIAVNPNTVENYTWLLVCAAILAFIAAYGIGANDVANSFATSVGAKSISMRQAVVLASIFEFLGAVSMGSSVSDTMRKGIANVECFEDNPGLLMYGMTCVIMATGIWLILASAFEMPVSTTHSCVGGIIGMTMMARSTDCVVWYEKSDTFPYMKGVSAIVVSWVLSPVASGVVAAIIFASTRFLVLRHGEAAFFRAKCAFPIIVGVTCGINAVFLIIKGTKDKAEELGTDTMVAEAKDGDITQVAIAGVCVAAVTGLLTALATPKLARAAEERVAARAEEDRVAGAELENGGVEVTDIALAEKKLAARPDECNPDDKSTPAGGGLVNTVIGSVQSELNADAHAVLETNKTVGDIHANATRYDAKAEEMFKYVQVFTAIVNAFSHGANDVANAMGPFSAVYFTWLHGAVGSEADVGDDIYWILAIGGAGIVLGLATYGYKIMQAIGVKLVAVTPSRGFCIELGAVFVIIYGTTQGWPLSTTHCQVGATVGVGLFEGAGGINRRVLFKTLAGWVFTLVVVGFSAAFLVGPSPEPIRDMYCEDN